MGQVHTLYLIHHSHTDVGYTHDQPVLWDLYQRFIDSAIILAEKDRDEPDDVSFRWTIENTAPLYHWLQHASDRDIERLLALERKGRIEVTGTFANLTPLYDTDQLVESFQLVRLLREQYGFTIRYAMNCDVNGENWPFVDLLLDAELEGFSMAINTHFGGAPLQRPTAFFWEGPSSRRIPVWNGWPYDQGWRLGIGRNGEAFERNWWPRVEQYLDEIDYPLPILMVQSYHPFGDNGPAFDGFSQFVRQWNGAGKFPRLCLATPTMWWEALREYHHLLPTYRGDWTDYWNFGCGSSAREQAINRASRTRLRSADALAAAVLAGSDGVQKNHTATSFTRYRERAWWALNLWDEHTWGADCSIRRPYSEDTASQWYHKAGYAYTARSYSLLLQRDGLADLARRLDGGAPGDLFLFNPLPWPRQIAGQVPRWIQSPRGPLTDATAGRHFQDRLGGEDGLLDLPRGRGSPAGEPGYLMPPVTVPGFGYTVVSHSDLIDLWASTTVSEEAIIENGRFRISFDLEWGGVRSWYDKQLDHEWVDQEAGYPFNGYVHERIVETEHPWPRQLIFDMPWETQQVERPRGWQPAWNARRERPVELLSHRVYRTPLGYRAVQSLRAPGSAGPLWQSLFLPDYADHIECEAWWEMGLQVHPEATYLLYPLNVPDATVRIDLGGQAMRAGIDQLPGVCRDYFTAQQWVDFSNDTLGVTIALPDNPMVQLGDFHFGHNQFECEPERAMLLGWVTNNYWETNFRAHQPGRVHARYCLRPHDSGFVEAAAHRFGAEMANARPLLQHLGEERAAKHPLPVAGESLLHLPGSKGDITSIVTLHVKPTSDQKGILVRLLNASEEEQWAQIGSGLLQISAARACNLLETPLSHLEVRQGVVDMRLPARRVTTLHLTID